jgi:hypothetical protein
MTAIVAHELHQNCDETPDDLGDTHPPKELLRKDLCRIVVGVSGAVSSLKGILGLFSDMHMSLDDCATQETDAASRMRRLRGRLVSEGHRGVVQ